jgi:plastocyanin
LVACRRILGRHEVAQQVRTGSYKPGWLPAARLCGVAGLALGLVLILPAAARADASASFTYSPESPLTGEVVTFTSTSTGTISSLAWDLDGDGACDDATGPAATHAFEVAGTHSVLLCVNGGESEQRRTIVVRNRPPVASFTFAPSAPVTDEAITLGSTSVDPDGPITSQSWDLDGDGAFDDAAGETASVSFTTEGTHPVALAVTDRNGAASIALAFIRVVKPPLELLSPPPVVRMLSRFVPGGTVIGRFVVSVPRGTLLTVRCRGGGCPYRRRRIRAETGRIRLRGLERRLSPGTRIELFVMKKEAFGRYIRYRILRGRPPARVDRCVRPRTRRPVACPRT